MPQSRQHQRPRADGGPDSLQQELGPDLDQGQDNSFIAELLAGRMRLDGDAMEWFERGVLIQRGMRGSVVKELQEIIGAGADGVFGRGTEKALKAFQQKNGLAEDGVVDLADWEKLRAAPKRQAPKGEEAFAEMWEHHPHNYLDDASQNTDSGDLQESLGFDRNQFGNTCALRFSTMLNGMGGEFKITKEKALEAGLGEMREGGLYMPEANSLTEEGEKDRVILSAKEMWTYLQHQFGQPDQVWPPRGRNLRRADAQKAVEEVKATLKDKKGWIAFDNLQLQDDNGQYSGYGGSGHVDIFDGLTLSDGDFYPAQRIMVWYMVQ